MLRLFLLLALWPLSLAAQGTRTVTPTAGNATTSQSATANASISPPTLFTPPPPDSDDDGDGLSLALELIRGSDPNIPNTDGDAAPDALDGWPREAAITQPPLPATGYVHVPLSALHPAFPATGNPPFVVRRLGNDWRVLTETLLNSGPSTRELHLRDLRTGTSELVLTAPASYAAHCFGLSGVDADAFFAKYAMWMNSSPSGEHGPFGFPGISSYASNPSHRPDRAVARNGGIASCFFNGSSIQTRHRAPDGTTRLLPLNPLPIPPGGDVSFQTAAPLLVNDAGDVVTLEIGYFGRKNSSSATYYATRSKHLAIYLNRANGSSQRLGPGMDRLIRPTESTSGSIFLPYALTNEGKMMGQLFSADGSPALFGWWNDQFRPAPPGTGSALYVSAIDAAPGRPALGLTTKTPSGSRWAMEAPDGTVTWPDAEVWLPQQQVQGRPHQIRGLNSELEYVADAAITSQGSSVWNGVTRNGVFQQIPAPAGYSPIYTDINDPGALMSGRYLTIPASLTVDANRDGIIDDQDVNALTVAKPYRFWSNDDDDSGDTSGSDIPGQAEGQINLGQNADYSPQVNDGSGIGQIDGRRDLVDFFPVFLDIKQLLAVLPPSASIKYKLRHEQGALNFCYSQLTRADACRYQTDDMGSIFGNSQFINQPLTSATTYHITDVGYELSGTFLNGIKNNDWGVILVEGRSATTKPLVLSVEKSDGTVIAEVKLEIKISSVEDMYRRLNFRDSNGQPPPGLLGNVSIRDGDLGLPTSMSEPANSPDSQTNGKWFVMVVGSNVGGQKMRGWQSEVFKRMWWSGSKAKFIGVSWYGDPFDDSNDIVYNYHCAARNAFATAPALASTLNALPGSKTVAGHSAAALIISSAVADHGLNASNTCLLDAAMARECYDGASADHIIGMVPSGWQAYPSDLWASRWHLRFSGTGDARENLTWRNRFTNALNRSTVHNFYSSTEEVLGRFDGTLNASIIENLSAPGAFAWVIQEKAKGNKLDLLGLNLVKAGSDYGGWGFNFGDPVSPSLPTWYKFNFFGARIKKEPEDIGPPVASLLAGSMQHPLFRSGWGTYNGADESQVVVNTNPAYNTGPSWIFDLYGPSTGSAIAADPLKHTQLLNEAIPCMSLAIGSNRTTAMQDLNYNMPSLYASPSQWPSVRGTDAGGVPVWHHSDMREVAYIYLYGFFDKLSSIANQ